jgi:ribosome maturation factor RimP
MHNQVKRHKRKFKKQNQPVSRKNAQAVMAASKGLAGPLCESEGLELVHLEYQREPGGWILRLYIDKSGGVTLDDCATVSRQMNDLLDVHLDDIGPYNLEVTSPGPDSKGTWQKSEPFDHMKGRKTLKVCSWD